MRGKAIRYVTLIKELESKVVWLEKLVSYLRGRNEEQGNRILELEDELVVMQSANDGAVAVLEAEVSSLRAMLQPDGLGNT